MRLLFILLFTLVFPFLIFIGDAHAQPKKTIIVLDASGSMWGQIEGVTKIEIAQSVIAKLLNKFPNDQELGLTAYGHNRKGDCSDIETIVLPALNTRDQIRKAVNEIKPKGKTPLSAAVTQAAEALKFTEDPATVILISDGKETCDFDPCEVGKNLEESGVDFTAHVIGFDVGDIADRAQLKCLAENTGGKFLTASNAEELTKALEAVSAPEPLKMHEVRFVVVEKGTNLTINEGLLWRLFDNQTGGVLIEKEATNSIVRELTAGVYKAQVTRVKDNMTAERVVTIGDNSPVIFNLELPVMIPPATISAPDTAVIGSIIPVEWTGPNEHGDIINIREVGNMGSPLGVTHTSKGSPLNLQMPGKPGEYVIRYLLESARYKVLATHPIKIEAVGATLNAPATAKIGSTISVEWTGPNYKRDYVEIKRSGTNKGHPERTKTSKGSPLDLQVPTEPGSYEIRYVLGDSYKHLVTRPIKVEAITATLNAPLTASVGSIISVEWTGPNYKRDKIAISKVGSDKYKTVERTRVSKGSPLQLKMPKTPGKYEVRYVLDDGGIAVIGRRAITVQ